MQSIHAGHDPQFELAEIVDMLGLTPAMRTFVVTVFGPILVFWLVLFGFGFPSPFEDDLFFVGAAINLVHKGELVNPLTEAWNTALPSPRFYYYPPFHAYVLAGWLWLCGISTTSFLLFNMLCYLTASTFSALMLHAYQVPRAAIFATVAAYAFLMNTEGLRADALALAFLACGLWFLTRDHGLSYWAGFICLGASVLSYQGIIPFAFSFGLAAVLTNAVTRPGQERGLSYVLPRLLALAGAGLVVLTLFLLCIDFDLRGFVANFSATVALRRSGNTAAVFIQLLLLGWGGLLNLPTYALFLALAGFALFRWSALPGGSRTWIIALLLAFVLTIFLYAGLIPYTTFFAQAASAILIATVPARKRSRYVLAVGYVLVFVSSQSLMILALAERDYASETPYEEIRKAVAARPQERYAVSAPAARLVFDYHLPANTVDWWTLMPPPALPPQSVADKRPGVTWIVAKAELHDCIADMPVDSPRVELLGRRFHSLPRRPYDIVFLP